MGKLTKKSVAKIASKKNQENEHRNEEQWNEKTSVLDKQNLFE